MRIREKKQNKKQSQESSVGTLLPRTEMYQIKTTTTKRNSNNNNTITKEAKKKIKKQMIKQQQLNNNNNNNVNNIKNNPILTAARAVLEDSLRGLKCANAAARIHISERIM